LVVGRYKQAAKQSRNMSDVRTSVTNMATVSGGGEINTANDTASDPTTVK
jgi:hypothetical protein